MAWEYETFGPDGQCKLFGVNIFNYDWQTTGKRVKVQDPIYHQDHNLANRFVGELMEQLVQDGLLVTTKTRNGPGVRTATDAEISSPLPGQQQMTL